jgi:hypothetical protein
VQVSLTPFHRVRTHRQAWCKACKLEYQRKRISAAKGEKEEEEESGEGMMPEEEKVDDENEEVGGEGEEGNEEEEEESSGEGPVRSSKEATRRNLARRDASGDPGTHKFCTGYPPYPPNQWLLYTHAKPLDS